MLQKLSNDNLSDNTLELEQHQVIVEEITVEKMGKAMSGIKKVKQLGRGIQLRNVECALANIRKDVVYVKGMSTSWRKDVLILL